MLGFVWVAIVRSLSGQEFFEPMCRGVNQVARVGDGLTRFEMMRRLERRGGRPPARRRLP
jgi:hypothetical protein